MLLTRCLHSFTAPDSHWPCESASMNRPIASSQLPTAFTLFSLLQSSRSTPGADATTARPPPCACAFSLAPRGVFIAEPVVSDGSWKSTTAPPLSEWLKEFEEADKSLLPMQKSAASTEVGDWRPSKSGPSSWPFKPPFASRPSIHAWCLSWSFAW